MRVPLLCAALLAGCACAEGKVLINEIMYNPLSQNPKEEYIELFNQGPEAVNLEGWKLHTAVDFTFPNVTLAAGGYLVVAADPAVFQQKYPGVANMVGGWTGTLANRDQDINLDDGAGKREDSVHYATEGDWAVRARGPLDHGHRGWIWVAAHNGQGKSLELINQDLSNNHGQNWAASIPAGGTPGRANSVARANIAPMILDAAHFPGIPKSTDPVTVTAQLLDEQTNGLSATVHYRLDGQDTFVAVPMADDGLHGDGQAGDGFYGAVLPPQANNAIVEFYLEASDAAGNRRTWPAPIQTGAQTANLLYQVRDAGYTGSQPLYLLIMREAERAELADLGQTLPDAFSDALMNGTFISVDDHGTTVRYTVGIRNRGHGTRTAIPNNYHVAFPNDRRWQGRRAVTLNSQYTQSQVLGSALFQKAGFAALDTWAVQVRVNNANLAKSGQPMFGSYAALELLDTDYLNEHFPGDSEGNAYRGIASDPPSTAEADLYYRGTNPDAYRSNYFKQNNTYEDDWTDLIELTRVLSLTSPANLPARVETVLDLDQWLRYFAMNALLDNNETGIYMGFGDDYALYRGVVDPRFKMLPYDLDTLMGQGSEPGKTDASVFRATAIFVLDRLLHNPAIEPRYYGALRELIETVFSPGELNPLIDQALGGWVAPATIDQMKNFAAQRNAYVLSILPHLVSFTASWKFRQPNAGLAPDWVDPAFDDSGWTAGNGLFYFDSRALPAPKGTPLKLGKSTYYFRTHFSIAASQLNNGGHGALTLSTIIDDGAVFYLNGKEIFRLGMADGPVDYSTTANRLVGLAALEGPFTVAVDNLVAGDNLLAVEVHQTDPSSSDIVFGATVDLASSSATPNIPVLLSEVFAARSSSADGDWVELVNRSGQGVNLDGAGLTDNDQQPGKWIFPPNSIVPANGYLVIQCNGNAPPSGTNTGFSLKASGDNVYLFAPAAKGGGLIDSINFGLQAAGYSIARVASGLDNGWGLSHPTPGRDNDPANLGTTASLRVNEWMANPLSGNSWFELYNRDSSPVRLSGLYLSDDLNARKQSRVPPLSFMAAGAAGFQKFEADGDPGQGADHVNFKLSHQGESVAIFAGDGSVIDQVTFGPQEVEVSQGRFPDGAAQIVPFPGSASPGRSNFLLLTNVVINELLAHSSFPLENAIELYNPTGANLDLAGWYLSDDPQFLAKFQIPPGTVVPAGGFHVFYAYQFDPDPTSPARFHWTREEGGAIYLSQVNNGALTGYRAFQEFGPSEEGVSFGRYNTTAGADFVPMEKRTFGADAPASLAEFRSGAGLANSGPKIGPIVISELMYRPQAESGSSVIEEPALEFVELLNLSGQVVPLYDPQFPTNTWALNDGIEFRFPEGANLAPGANLLVVSFDPATDQGALDNFRAHYSIGADQAIFGPYQGKLSNSGEAIELDRPAAPEGPDSLHPGAVPYLLVDRVDYRNAAPWPVTGGVPGTSLQKINVAGYGNEPANWVAAAPTPGKAGSVPVELRFGTPSITTNGILLRFATASGASYSVEFRDSLSEGSWVKLVDWPARAGDGLAEIPDSLPAGKTARFYRLVRSP